MGFSQAEQMEQYVTTQLTKWVGAVPLVLPILKRLQVAEIVDEHCRGKEQVPHGTVVSALALNRLMAPQPLYKVGEWLGDTILEDALDVEAEQLYDSRLGRTLDDIHPQLAAIWEEIVVQAVVQYNIDLSQVHYDITSIYFEGAYDASETIDYGYSRDQRPDAKQRNLGLNVTGQDGIPLAYRVLAGRTADRTTPLENMQALQQLLERAHQVAPARDFLLVSDRAMLDPSVLLAYQAQGVAWLGPLAADGSLRAVLPSVSHEELDAQPLDYRPRSQPADEPPRYYGSLRRATVEQDGQAVPLQLLVVKSHGKLKLDRQRRATYLQRLTERLDDIQGMLNTRKYKRKAYAQQQIDKACQGNPAQHVEIELTGSDGNLPLAYRLNEQKLAEAEALDGRYLLGTNQHDLGAHQMLRRFKRQEVIERRIKTIKGPVALRPLFLHNEERIEGLVFVSMLALLLYTILEMLCRRAGHHITARHVLETFERLGAIYLPFADGSWLKVASALTDAQRHLLELLRFPPPASYWHRPAGP
ncbi:MAG: IS1634 family transposase [Chloroflexota bacterium]|nr:IS1634 family transposase [Chloroflexota bacterium]